MANMYLRKSHFSFVGNFEFRSQLLCYNCMQNTVIITNGLSYCPFFSYLYQTFLYAYSHLITYLVTRHDKIYGMPFFELSIRILAQILGGLMAYRLNQFAWNFFLTPTHWYQTYNTSYGNCWTFLNVPTTFGFIIGQHTCKAKTKS